MEPEKQVLMVLANYNFNDDEYSYTRKSLEDNGIGVKIVAGEPGICTSETGTSVDVDVSFQSVDPDEFKGIVFIGGPGVDSYFNDDFALEMAKKFFDGNKVVAAICWAPVILVRAGILSHRKATAWDGAKDDLKKGGCIYTGERVTTDNLVVTASGPESATDFGETIAGLLK